MPRKVRELKADLGRAGFRELKRRGKGSHSAWGHSQFTGTVLVSGGDGDDAAPYQEKQVRKALQALEQAGEDQR